VSHALFPIRKEAIYVLSALFNSGIVHVHQQLLDANLLPALSHASSDRRIYTRSATASMMMHELAKTATFANTHAHVCFRRALVLIIGTIATTIEQFILLINY
jgi:hypothetical protein